MDGFQLLVLATGLKEERSVDLWRLRRRWRGVVNGERDTVGGVRHGGSMTETPESVVQAQLDAYNARDVEAILRTYAEDARHYEYPGNLLAEGVLQLRERFRVRFAEPNLRARLIRRTVVGSTVIDHEEVSRTFPEGTGTLELVAIYVVREGRIVEARFISGPRILDSERRRLGAAGA